MNINSKQSISGSIYVTGDTHRNFQRVADFCEKIHTSKSDTLIILGDAGINYYGYWKDLKLKKQLESLPITLFCIHGNHEQRPKLENGYKEIQYHGGVALAEPEYQSIVFGLDGEVYKFAGHNCIVIGGAYSIDKQYRVTTGAGWWPDEQPSKEIKGKVENKLAYNNWTVDTVLSHTCPLKYMPTEVFLPGYDQSIVDQSTEEWLGGIESKLSYNRWYCGHFHTEKQVDRIKFMFNNFDMIS